MKKILLLVLVTITISLFSFLLFKKSNEIYITSFEECAKQYPVLESYPPVCVTTDGKRFVLEIGNEMALSDSIRLASPRPNQKVASPIVIQGEARGNWFFEAQIQAELTDMDGVKMGDALLTADADWMTDDFVPFSGFLKYELLDNVTEGKLIIKNANPSGLVEHSRELIIPVRFQQADHFWVQGL